MGKLYFIILLCICLFAQYSYSQNKIEKSNHYLLKYKNSKNNVVAANKYRPHRAVEDSTTQHLYTYNEEDKSTIVLRQSLDNNIWINVERITYTYDGNSNLLSQLEEKWQDNSWIIRRRFSSTYDHFGNELTWLYEKYENGKWTNYRRNIFTYDNEGKILTAVSQNYTNNNWLNSSRESSTYNSEGRISVYINEVWSDSSWQNNSRVFYTYINNTKDHYFLSARWINNEWNNDDSTYRTHDNMGRLLTEYSLKYHHRISYTYGFNGKLAVSLRETSLNDIWLNDHREIYTYNNMNNELSYISEKWNSNSWVNSDKRVYTYDSKGNGIKGEIYKWINNQWEYFDYGSNIYLPYNNGNDVLFFYATIVEVEYNLITDIKDNVNKPLCFDLEQNYPNPFNPSTTISYTLPKQSFVEVKIYDIIGSEIRTFILNTQSAGYHSLQWNGKNLSGEAVPSGIYIYRLKAISYEDGQSFERSAKMMLVK